MQASKTKAQKQIHVNELYSIREGHEGRILKRYIEFRLDELAQRALKCTKEELDELQGRARELESMLKDLTRPARDPNQ